MMHEIDLYGVLLSPLLSAFIAAWLSQQVLTRVGERIGFYRFVAQRPLFDLALLVILTALFTKIFFALEHLP